MPKCRKRFYTAVMNDGTIQVLSLRHRPTPQLITFNASNVYGPFRTLDAAVNHLEYLVGVRGM